MRMHPADFAMIGRKSPQYRASGPRVSQSQGAAVREIPGDHDVYCLTVPEAGNFALEAGVFVKNCGIIVNVTPLEPEWEGHVTLEFSNTTPLPAKIYANEGVAQMLFFESDEICETSYRDRGGKVPRAARRHPAESLRRVAAAHGLSAARPSRRRSGALPRVSGS